MIGALIMAMACGGASEVALTAPDFDRWNYGFNATPGLRAVGSTFSAYESGYPFDDRDGQVLLGFVTGGAVEPALPPSAYEITSCSVTLSLSSDDIVLDTTQDDVSTYGAAGEPDSDPGRPTILTGAAFRNGWSAWTWGEDGAFGEVMAAGVRNCYPIDFDEGVARDISNSLTNGFNPHAWSVGQVDGVNDGELIPAWSVMRFDIDVADPDIRCALRASLADGLIDLMVTSLHVASEPGSGGEANYPDWVMKEHAMVDLGIASAASLQLTVEVVPPTGLPGDVSGDGLTNVEDLLAVLEAFGRCPCCAADIDQTGVVDVNDLLAVIAGWGG